MRRRFKTNLKLSIVVKMTEFANNIMIGILIMFLILNIIFYFTLSIGPKGKKGPKGNSISNTVLFPQYQLVKPNFQNEKVEYFVLF